MNEFRIKIERKYGESFKPTMFQTYMTAGQMLIYQKDMLALGELTEVKNIRHECDFMMRDFRKRIASMFFPAFEAGIGHFYSNRGESDETLKNIPGPDTKIFANFTSRDFPSRKPSKYRI